MSNIKLAVFDMAGTTINEDNVVYKTIHMALENEGIHIPFEQVLAHAAGKEKHQAIIDTLTNCSELNSVQIKETAATVFSNFKALLEENYQKAKITPFPGIKDLFVALRNNGIKVVLNTGYDEKTANTVLKKAGWKVNEDIDAMITASDVMEGRPHAEMIKKAMDMFNITETQSVLKAGDSIIDIEEGKNASCGITVGVLSGAHNRAQLESAHPDYVVEDLTQIQSFIL